MADYVHVPPSSGGSSTTDYEYVKVTFDGQGAALEVGAKAYAPYLPAGTIVGWEMVADVSGSVVIDVWKRAYSAGVPTVAHTITASAKPTLSSAQKNADTTLTGWTTSVSASDIVAFNVDSCTTITQVTLILKIEKS
jgi:hypothetical protein